MNILNWVYLGKVSAERDDQLSNYFFDNGVLKSVIDSPSSFLILGRKGAGKTAVFKHLIERKQDFIGAKDILVPLSFEDYNWNIHSLLINTGMAESLSYKQSWRFIILVECIKAYREWFVANQQNVPKPLDKAHKLLEKLFDSPVPSIYQIVGRKMLSLAALKLPKAGLDLEDGALDGISVDGGEVSFEEFKANASLKNALSENIDNLINQFDATLNTSDISWPRLFICFDRVDEAWDDVSYETSKKVIAGLISASESICTYYKGKIRPIVFLREDIFEVLSINDANKLREDCGEFLKWDKVSLLSMILRRLNYYASQHNAATVSNLDSLFDKQEMRQRTKPSNYLIKRTMMRPRDLISLLNRVVDTMKEKSNDPFAESPPTSFEKLEAESIYGAEPGYSEWLKQEILDEWRVQKPQIDHLFNALQNNASTNFTKNQIETELQKINTSVSQVEVTAHLRFLFDNSIIGFKLGESKEWRFKCFYPSQGFIESEEYRVHEGLVRSLNLKESREREENQ